jgi:murein DD-endopeptidase MepM/ murein hydrolase activator NlpD
VTLVIRNSYYNGNVVVVDHGLGVASLYSHMDEIKTRQGQLLAAGDVVGTVGSTGRSTGPHLHFAISFFDSFLDPEDVINNSICNTNKRIAEHADYKRQGND